MTPQDFLHHIGWHKETKAVFSYTALADTLQLFLDKQDVPAPFDFVRSSILKYFTTDMKKALIEWMGEYEDMKQDVPVGLEQYAPTKEELLLANKRAIDHAILWGGPADSHASYLTGFAHGIGYGRNQELKRVQQAQAGAWVKVWEEVERELFDQYTIEGLANAASKAHSKVHLWKSRLSESPSLPVNLPIEEMIKLSDEDLSKEINKVRARLGMSQRNLTHHEQSVLDKTTERIFRKSLPVKEQIDWQAKFKEANQFIIDLAKSFGQEGLGYDDMKWSIEDFKNAAKEQMTDFALWVFHNVTGWDKSFNAVRLRNDEMVKPEQLFLIYTQSLQNKP